MTIPESVSLILEAASYAKNGEIFVLDMGEPVRIVDLAEKMIRLAGLKPYEDIDIEFIGLRDGEKKFEELILDDKAKKTHKKKIFIDPIRITLEEMWEKSLTDIDNLKISQIRSILSKYISDKQEKVNL
jgi:FlaA1/EpsC-like NDP-sugar epimerase